MYRYLRILRPDIRSSHPGSWLLRRSTQDIETPEFTLATYRYNSKIRLGALTNATPTRARLNIWRTGEIFKSLDANYNLCGIYDDTNTEADNSTDIRVDTIR